MSSAEITGWRDLALSRRHRLWGVKLPAVDIDLFLEYDYGSPAALIEYKSENAEILDPNHFSYIALIELSNRGKIPFFAARYTRDFTKWVVTPLNKIAINIINVCSTFDEQGFVRLLYKLRGLDEPF